MRVITLTTDFGTEDWYVGAMKGVILGIHPTAQIVDLTHEIPFADIRAGALALYAAAEAFPPETIHVAVVDPGVGGSRAPIAIQTAKAFFVGPDNGLLSWACPPGSIVEIRRLTEARFFRPEVSRTFHGRDIFAPVAAHLSRGETLSDLGPTVPEFVRLPWPTATVAPDRVCGEILHLDRFGNAITNVGIAELARLSEGKLEVSVGERPAVPLADYYQSVPTGSALALIGSTKLVEVSVNGGSAADRFGLRVGDRIVVSKPQVRSRSQESRPEV